MKARFSLHHLPWTYGRIEVQGSMTSGLIRRLASRLPRQIKTADLFFLLSAIPVLVLFLIAPESFGLSWAGMGKLGRGGLLFVLFFIAFELIDFRKTTNSHLSKNRKLVIGALFALGLLYFGAVGLFKPFTDSIYWVGRILGASGDTSNSWLMATDYVAMTLYIFGLATAFFGGRGILKVITGIVLSAGMLVMYLLDAFFPYGSLGPLQFWANFIVAAVAFLTRGVGLPIYGKNNMLTISGKHGFYQLFVFWPSVGVQSMLIYSLVMIILAAKLYAPAMRKITYAAVGVAGTVFLNVVRISIIAFYGYAYATSGADLDAFHNSIGEFLFPVWIVVFLWIVLDIEGRLAARSKRATMKTGQAPAAAMHDTGYRLPYATRHTPTGATV
jgi:thaumarchaeosortase